MSLAVVNARLIDPATGRDEAGGVIAHDGAFESIGAVDISGAEQVIDAGGKILAPALVDLRVAKEPAFTADAETAATLAQAALAGGVGTVCLAPNAISPLDKPEGVAAGQAAARELPVRLLTACGATTGLSGAAMAEIGLMKSAGAVYAGCGDDPVGDARLLRRLFAYAADLDMALACRPAEPALSRGGVATEGDQAARLGLPSEPAVSERLAIDRDSAMAELAGGRLLVDRLSTAEGLAALRRARKRGASVQATAAIAHLAFNEVDAGGLDSAFRMMPPLRAEADRLALVRAVASGEIDAVVSDHRPTPVDDKQEPFAEAVIGTLSLETLLGALLGLVLEEEVELTAALRAVTSGPADLLGLPQGRLDTGAPADFILIDPDLPWVVDPQAFRSARSNSAWAGRRMTGRVTHTFIGGDLKFQL